MSALPTDGRVVALSGGVGGAKLALGLYRVLPPDSLTVIVNTGDDFDHLGLRICPDLDTTLYTLAGLAHPEAGWGRRDETWTFMRALESLGSETWFRLGDGDLALHVERTRRLARDESLTAFIGATARRLGIRAAIVPMSDDPVRTRVMTDHGELGFQEYFVRLRCEPAVRSLRFEGAAAANVSAAAADALDQPGLAAVIVCPSNPFLSIDPILAVPEMRSLLKQAAAPVIAVSPLIGEHAVKGPTAKIMRELGWTVAATSVAEHYGDLIDGFVLDERDREQAGRVQVPLAMTDTLMTGLPDRERVARAALALARELRDPGPAEGPV